MLLLAACGRVGFDARTADLAIATPPAAPLANYPLPLFLDGVLAPGPVAVTANGAALPVDIESLDPFIAWVRVPLLDATTRLHVAPGDSAGGAFDDRFVGVWHLAGDARDATGQRDGVATAVAPTDAIVGTGLAYHQAAHSCITVPDGGVTSPITLSGWMRYDEPPVASGTGFYDLITRELGDAEEDDFLLGEYDDHPLIGIHTDVGKLEVDDLDPIALGAWHLYAATYDGANSILYLDGAEVGRSDTTGAITASGGPIYIGCDRNNQDGTSPPDLADIDYLDGALDEVRVANVALPPEWLAYDAIAMKNEALRDVADGGADR